MQPRLMSSSADKIELLLTLVVCVQANVIVEVEEVKRPFSGDLGVFSKPEVSGWF